MKIVELILDEEQDNFVEAISVVEYPAIEEDFVALKTQEFKFAEQDKDRKILIGPVLIPNKPIFRKSGEEEYYIYFSRDTVKKASQLYLKQGHQSNSTLEHESKIQGLTLVESWIVEDKENDKSNSFGMDVPLGTWMGSVKVDNDEIWNDYVKTGKVKGFSIEGYFADKVERPQDKTIKDDLQETEKTDQDLLDEVLAIFEVQPIVVNESYAIIGNRLAYSTQEEAERMAKDLGCKGHHTHDVEGTIWYMPCEAHEMDLDKDDNPCWDGYEMIGMKELDGRMVPNCVKIK